MAEFRVKDEANFEGPVRVSAPEGVAEIPEGGTVTVDDEDRGLIAVLESSGYLERVDDYEKPLADDEAPPTETAPEPEGEPAPNDSPTSTVGAPSVALSETYDDGDSV